jgi:hypothetical protein
MEKKESPKPDAIEMITSYVSTNPGTNFGRTSTALLPFFTASYTQALLRQMIARKQLMAVVSSAHRYQLYTPEQVLTPEPAE